MVVKTSSSDTAGSAPISWAAPSTTACACACVPCRLRMVGAVVGGLTNLASRFWLLCVTYTSQTTVHWESATQRNPHVSTDNTGAHFIQHPETSRTQNNSWQQTCSLRRPDHRKDCSVTRTRSVSMRRRSAYSSCRAWLTSVNVSTCGGGNQGTRCKRRYKRVNRYRACKGSEGWGS